MDVDLTTEPLGTGGDGQPVYLRDIWPSQREIADAIETAIESDMFRKSYGEVFEGDETWKALAVPEGDRYAWDEQSTYVKQPPYFEGMPREPPEGFERIEGARALALLGDSVTTDHISPAGAIKKDSPGGQYLIEHGVEPKDFNSYGSRRGNHEVMMRGTFANVRLRNQLAPGTEGGFTVHLPDGEQMTIFDAAMRYAEEGVPLCVLAGKEYGSGSSRDWAAKGPRLLGVRFAIAESYERIHRSNLVGMGVLPLQFPDGESVASLGLTGHELFDLAPLEEGARTLEVTATPDSGDPIRVRGAGSDRHAQGVALLPPRRHPPLRPSGAARIGLLSVDASPALERVRWTRYSTNKCSLHQSRKTGAGKKEVSDTPMDLNLTKRQQEIFDFIKRYGAKYGYPPTVREIGKAVGLASSSTVHAHLANLEKYGVLGATRPSRGRSSCCSTRPSRRSRPSGLSRSSARSRQAQPVLAEENIEEYVQVPAWRAATRASTCCRCRARACATPASWRATMWSCASRTRRGDGDIVVALLGEEATVKRFFKERTTSGFSPRTPAMEPIRSRTCEVLGRVVGSVQEDLMARSQEPAASARGRHRTGSSTPASARLDDRACALFETRAETASARCLVWWRQR